MRIKDATDFEVRHYLNSDKESCTLNICLLNRVFTLNIGGVQTTLCKGEDA